MHLAISGTELDPSDSISVLINAAHSLKVPHLEVWHPKNFQVEGAQQSISLIREAGLRVACVSTGSELYRAGGSSADQELLLEGIEIAHDCGAPFANTYFGYCPAQDDAAAVEVYLKHLEPCLKRATQLGVTIVLENEFNAFGVDPAKSDITRRPRSLLKLVETADSPHFKLNFDACNFYCAGVEPYPYAYEMLKGYIAYVHVKDGSVYDPDIHKSPTLWRRYRDYEQEYIMRPMGGGAVNWAALLARLSAEGYSGFLTLEPHSAKSEMASAWAQAIGYVNAFLHRSEEEDRYGN